VIFVPKSNREYQILANHYKTSETRLIRDRAHAVILSMQGRSIPDIGNILLRSENTIRLWLQSFKKTRLGSVFPSYSGNTNASKLTEEQLAEIQETLGKPPSNKKGSLPERFWNIKKLREYIKAEYGVVYESERSYHHIFTLSEFSFKLPEGFDQRRNDKLVKQRMIEIQGEIEQKQRQGYSVFFADECSLCFETEYRRAWLPKGEKTILKVNREKIRQNYFGALNIQSKKEELISLSWQNTETIIGALRELTKRYRDQKLCIVWDNAGWHRSKELRALLGKGKEFSHIRFIWMPPYAPDKNPQEHVWKAGKEAVKNVVTETFDELKKIFEKTIKNKKFDYKMLSI
jgi:transposase